MMNMRTINNPAKMLKNIRTAKMGIRIVADRASARNRIVEIV
jgi:hypothetical protein